MPKLLPTETIQDIRRLYKKGYFLGQICKELGVSKTAVRNHTEGLR